MRLLNTTTIELREFLGDNVPEYAIVSHTWGDDELLYRDVIEDTQRQRKGWKKVLDCCKTVLEHGWQWVWIDTCCIDKSSSAELSEAINSMFQWYLDAEVCYAFLQDVDLASFRAKRSALRSSRWFSRGWTLQELLAPPFMVFFDKDWLQIGHRSVLLDDISRATGIPEHQLRSYRQCSVAQKMSWAAFRQTTRLEDQAYCLLGLFDINMPLLYGEGTKAFGRLQEEILKTSDDETIFAWQDTGLTGSGFHSILARHPAAFSNCGRVQRCTPACNHWSALTDPARKPAHSITNKGLLITVDLFEARQEKFPQLPPDGPPWAEKRYMAPLSCCSGSGNDQHAICLGRRQDGLLQRCHLDRIADFPARLRSDHTIKVEVDKTVYINTRSGGVASKVAARPANFIQLVFKYDPLVTVKECIKAQNGSLRPKLRNYTELYPGQSVDVSIDFRCPKELGDFDPQLWVLRVRRADTYKPPIQIRLVPGVLEKDVFRPYPEEFYTDCTTLTALSLGDIDFLSDTHHGPHDYRLFTQLSPLPSAYETPRYGTASARLTKRYQIEVSLDGFG